jgi:YD repeat-containing protein
VTSRDVTGNRSVSPDYSFTTDTLAYIRYAVKELGPYSAKIEWAVNYACQTVLRYGDTPECNNTKPSTYGNYNYLNGLMPGKRYYFYLESSGYGRSLRSQLLSFVTPAIKPFGVSKGLLTRTSDQSGETVYGYDERGRMITRRVKYNGNDAYYFFNYDYDKVDNLTVLTYPDASKKIYSYNNNNRLVSIYGNCGDLVKKFSYTAAGACSTETYSNGVSGLYSYHPRLWLKKALWNKGAAKYFDHRIGRAHV